MRERWRIVIGSDDGGLTYKNALKSDLAAQPGVAEVVDLGVHSDQRTPYVQVPEVAARSVSEGRADRALLICSSGLGVDEREQDTRDPGRDRFRQPICRPVGGRQRCSSALLRPSSHQSRSRPTPGSRMAGLSVRLRGGSERHIDQPPCGQPGQRSAAGVHAAQSAALESRHHQRRAVLGTENPSRQFEVDVVGDPAPTGSPDRSGVQCPCDREMDKADSWALGCGQVMSVSVKPWLADRQPSSAVGCSR